MQKNLFLFFSFILFLFVCCNLHGSISKSICRLIDNRYSVVDFEKKLSLTEVCTESPAHALKLLAFLASSGNLTNFLNSFIFY